MDTPKHGLRSGVGLIGALLALDALTLIAQGLFHLGVILPLLLGVATLLWAWQAPRWQAWVQASPRRTGLWRFGVGGLLVWGLSVAVFFAVISQGQQRALPTTAPAAILILGSGTPHCQASPTLQARLNRGLELAHRWPQSPVVVSGGQDWLRHCTEAQVMADALRHAGLNSPQLWQEDRSTSTDENLRWSRQVLLDHHVDMSQAIAVVTSDFHVPRTERIARHNGFTQPVMVAAPTPLYLRYNAWLREYFAFLSSTVLHEY